MKNIRFYYEAICLVGTMACVAACSENTMNTDAENESVVLTSVQASLPTDASSRVIFTDATSKMTQVWKENDQIIINDNQAKIGEGNQFTLDKGANSATGAVFKGSFEYGTGASSLFAYYPVSNKWTIGTNSGIMAFNFAEQDGTREGLANCAVMADTFTPSTSPSIQFHNMTALMKFMFTFPNDGVASAAEYYFDQAYMYNNGNPKYNSTSSYTILWYPQDKSKLGGIKVTLPSGSTALTSHKSTVYFAMPASWWANDKYHQGSTKNMIIRVPVGTSSYYAGIINKDQLLEPGKMYTVSKSLVAAQYANAEATTFTDNGKDNFWLIDNANVYCLGGVESALKALKTANSTRKITLVLPGYTTTDVTSQFAQDCTNLEKVYIPAATGNIPYRTFENCTSLTTFSAPYATSVGTADGTSEQVFHGCTALTNVDIPNVTTIGTNAFDGCSALASINLPKVTSIGGQAFANCSALTEINLPMLQTITGAEVFAKCTKLTKITLGGGTDWGGFLGINTANLTSLFNSLGSTTCTLYLPNTQKVDKDSHKWTVVLKDGSDQTQTIDVTVFQHVYVGTTQIW